MIPAKQTAKAWHKARIGGPVSGLFCATLLFASTGLASPALAQSPDSQASADARVIEELYEDEVHDFGAMHDSLTVAQKAVFSRIVDRLGDGQLGLFGLLLVRATPEARQRFFTLFGGFNEAEFDEVTAELAERSFEKWGAIMVLLDQQPVENVRGAFFKYSTDFCQDEPEAPVIGNDDIDPFEPVAEGPCRQAVGDFFRDYTMQTDRVVTMGYVLPEGAAPYQAQLSLFGASTRFYHSREERARQRSQFGRELPDWQINHVCGAIYIGERFILTAAHCIGGLAEDKFFDRRRIRLGSRLIDGLHNLEEIRAVLVHRDYNPDTLQNDIALIELADPPSYRRLSSVNLPTRRNWRPSSNNLLLTGWGYRRATTSSSLARGLDGEYQDRAIRNLQGGEINIVGTEKCRDNAVFREHGLRVYPGQLCAGTNTGVDSCRGDSGGPLVEETTNTLVGIVSGGKGCGLFGVPSLYVDVAHYLSWIEGAKRAIRRADDQSKGVYPAR